VTVLLGCAPELSPLEPALLPEPNLIERREGGLRIDGDTRWVAPASLEAEGRLFAALIDSAALPLERASEGRDGDIELLIDPALAPEAAVLDIDASGLRVRGGSAEGVFSGLMYALQLFPPGVLAADASASHYDLPAIHLEHTPRFSHRGVLLDEARWFFGPAYVRRLLDWMALHGMNVLHWHLSDDQGFRVEIRAYPRLTEVGAFRSASQLGSWWNETTELDGLPHGGFYTQDEIRELVAYASERHITIIPELDVPGHTVAMLAAYPELGCDDRALEVSPDFRIHDDVLCVCEETTFAFLETVFDELLAIFPSERIHLGGDEVPTVRYEESTQCGALLSELGMSDAGELGPWAVARLAGFLERRGRRAIVWEEALSDALPASVIVQHWRAGTDAHLRAIESGHDVIVTPSNTTYLSAPSDRLPIADVYAFDPAEGVAPADEARILGTEACAWTPWMKNTTIVEERLFPRLAAIAERASGRRELRSLDEFRPRLLRMQERYTALGIRFGAP
jgi:hexosaminidase